MSSIRFVTAPGDMLDGYPETLPVSDKKETNKTPEVDQKEPVPRTRMEVAEMCLKLLDE